MRPLPAILLLLALDGDCGPVEPQVLLDDWSEMCDQEPPVIPTWRRKGRVLADPGQPRRCRDALERAEGCPVTVPGECM